MSSHSYWSPQRSSMGTLLCCLALIAVVLAVYNPVIRNSFVNYDDEGYIVQNAHVRAGLTRDTVKWAFTTYDQSNWHPLTWLSHALDCEIFGLNPAGHHYTSVLLHAANAVLLFLLLQSATGFRWRSLMVAALFALHPINVESVAWAAERKNVLSMMFFLLALYAYTWYARSPDVRRYAVVTVAFALRADVEAAGCYISVPALVVGLLAAAEDRRWLRRGKRCRLTRKTFDRLAALGKVAVAGARGGQFVHHHEGAAGRGHCQSAFAL